MFGSGFAVSVLQTIIYSRLQNSITAGQTASDKREKVSTKTHPFHMQLKVPEEAWKYHIAAHALLLQPRLEDCPHNAPG
jgi:hypothetical protein